MEEPLVDNSDENEEGFLNTNKNWTHQFSGFMKSVLGCLYNCCCQRYSYVETDVFAENKRAFPETNCCGGLMRFLIPCRAMFCWMWPILCLGCCKMSLRPKDLPKLSAQYTSTHYVDRFKKFWNRTKWCRRAQLPVCLYLVFGLEYLFAALLRVIATGFQVMIPFFLSFYLHEFRPMLTSSKKDDLSHYRRILPNKLVPPRDTNELGYRDNDGMIWLWLFLMAIFQFFGYLFSQNAYYFSTRVGGKMRVLLGALITEKVFTIRSDRIHESIHPKGELLNYFANDAFMVDVAHWFILDLIGAVIIVGVAIYFLGDLIGVSAIFVFLTAAVILTLVTFLTTFVFVFRKRYFRWIDRRITKMRESFYHMKIIKWFQWEEIYTKKILKIRRNELWNIRLIFVCLAIVNALGICAPQCLTIAGFGHFYIYNGYVDVINLFAASSYFLLLRIPMISFAQNSILYFTGLVSMLRIQTFLQEPDFVEDESFKRCIKRHDFDEGNENAIEIENGSFVWHQENIEKVKSQWLLETSSEQSGSKSKKRQKGKKHEEIELIETKKEEKKTKKYEYDSDREEVVVIEEKLSTQEEERKEEENIPFCLHDINIHIPNGSLVMVVGKSGSGKTSFLRSVLGELVVVDPEKTQLYTNGAFGYCQQPPWIQNVSLRANILYTQEYDEERFKKVIKICHLEDDFQEQQSGPGGPGGPTDDDGLGQMEVGEAGSTVSSGQQSRISLARACYSNADIYLFDNVLANLDTRISAGVFEDCILDYLGGLTRIMVTKKLHLCSSADLILVFENGKIVERGTFDELMKINVDDDESKSKFLTLYEEGLSEEKSRMNNIETILDVLHGRKKEESNNQQQEQKTIIVEETEGEDDSSSSENDEEVEIIDPLDEQQQDGDQEQQQKEEIEKQDEEEEGGEYVENQNLSEEEREIIEQEEDEDDEDSENDEKEVEEDHEFTTDEKSGSFVTSLLQKKSTSKKQGEENERMKYRVSELEEKVIGLLPLRTLCYYLSYSGGCCLAIIILLWYGCSVSFYFIFEFHISNFAEQLMYHKVYGDEYTTQYYIINKNDPDSEQYYDPDLFNHYCVIKGYDCRTENVKIEWDINYHNGTLLQDGMNNNLSLGIYAVAVWITFCLVIMESSCFFQCFISRSQKMFKKALKRLINAPIVVFDRHPIGRLISRLSYDVASLENELLIKYDNVMNTFFVSSIAMLLVCVFTSGMFLPVLFVAIICYISIYLCIRKPTMELKRMEAVSRSPLFQTFSNSVLEGRETAKAYGVQEYVIDHTRKHIDYHNCAYYLVNVSVRALEEYLNIVSVFLVFFAGMIAIIIGYYFPESFQKDMFTDVYKDLGLGLTFAISLVPEMFPIAVSDFVFGETKLNAIERLEFYGNKIKKEKKTVDVNSKGVLKDFITRMFISHMNQHDEKRILSEQTEEEDGEEEKVFLKFKNVGMRYQSHLPWVLKNINFEVERNSRIGIVGKTGAGKTSLFYVLTRLFLYEEGEILLNGKDLQKEVNLGHLRNSISVLPAHPILFQGTIRSNLDPRNMCHDYELMEIIASCGGLGVVNQHGGLDGVVEENGSNFSDGESQILCLIRATLPVIKKEVNILLIDEFSSNVDDKVVEVVEKTINELEDVTILTISHDIKRVIRHDNILVLQEGTILEFDTPKNLLDRGPDSMFFNMVEVSADRDEIHNILSDEK